MTKELKHIDITHHPELLQLVEQVRQSNEPVLLREETEDVAIVRPLKRLHQPRILRGRVLTINDSLCKLVGSATSAVPTDASRKHEYLGEAFAPRQA